METRNILNGNYEIIKKIYSCEYGDIFQVKDTTSSNFYCLHILNNNFIYDEEPIINEIENHSKLEYPSVLKVISFSHMDFQKPKQPTLITEYTPNGTLLNLLNQGHKKMQLPYWNDTTKLICLYGIATGMHYLHSQKIENIFLQPSNVYLDENYFPKIFSYQILEKIENDDIYMDSKYFSPEKWEDLTDSQQSNVYSFAIIAYEIMSLKKPFENIPVNKMRNKVINGHRPLFNFPIEKTYQEMIEKCWSQNPDHRPTFSQIVEEFRTNENFITPTVDAKEFEKYVQKFHDYVKNEDVIKIDGPGCGSMAAKKQSIVIGLLKDDHEIVSSPLPYGKLQRRFIRNTNATKVYEQEGGTCYSFAACSAYINTILRIYGSRPPPSFKDCFKIAAYNMGNGGNPKESIRLLEEHFNYGVCCDMVNDLSIRDAITLSTIVSFSTSEEGWENVAEGNIVFRANGPETIESHASLIEGYDLEHDTYICKNSWGDKTAKPRFELSKTGPHRCKFYRVYFTLNNIRGKTKKIFQPKMEKFIGQLNGKKINCAWMDLVTATYCSEYLCEYHKEKEGPLKYLGYDVDQWIKLNLQRSHKYSLFDYYNNPDLEL